MNRFIKIIAITSSGIIILVVAISFFIKFAKISDRNKILEFDSKFIDDKIEIKYNNIGIPHVYAKNDKDLFFGIGYAHSENRFWQMDFYKRAAQGRLSEILGPEYILIDKFMRGLKIPTIANKIWQNMDKKTRDALKSYSNGINQCLETNSDNLPLEFSVLDYTPEKWEPIDCITIQRFYGLQFSPSLLTDLIFNSISKKIGIEMTKELIPNFEQGKKYNSIDTKVIEKDFLSDTTSPSQIISNLQTSLKKIGISNFSGGSNTWAIRKLSNTGSEAILANDIHLNMTIPTALFQMQAFSKNIHLTGYTVPGIPFFIIGRNDSISWGYTNMLTDAIDYFSETISKDGKNYLSNDSAYLPLSFRIDTINIRNQNPHLYYQRFAQKSIIISDFHIYNSRNNFLKKKNLKKIGKLNLTYRWTGTLPSNELSAMYKINLSNNWNDFLSATNNWSFPGVIFSYADYAGNIGLKPASTIPIRGKNNIPWKVNTSSDHNTDWQGFIYSTSLKNQYNPSRPFLAYANNFYSDTSAPYVSYFYDNHSRIHRIYEYLYKLKDFEIRDMKNMQLDNYSNYAEEILRIILPILNNSWKFLSSGERTALRELQNWDCLMTGNKVAPTIFNAFMINLIYKTFYDELGNDLFLDYTYNSSFAYNKILELLNTNSTLFFDNINTTNTENRQFLVFQSFKDAISYIKEYSGSSNIKDWNWSRFHKIISNHPLASNKHLSNIFSTSPVGISGSWETINYGSWEFRKPFNIHTGTAARFISDMKDSVVYNIIPGGSSGDPTNMHFSNQFRIWANGGYFKLIHSSQRIHSNNIRVLSPTD